MALIKNNRAAASVSLCGGRARQCRRAFAHELRFKRQRWSIEITDHQQGQERRHFHQQHEFTAGSRQAPRLAILVVQQLIGCVAVGKPLRPRVPIQPRPGCKRDIGQMRKGG